MSLLLVLRSPSGQTLSRSVNESVIAASDRTYKAAVLADSPVSYWRLGESSGTTVVDEQAANPGSYLGTAPTLSAPGLLVGDSDTAMSLPGGGTGRAQIPYASGINPTSGFSVEVWVKFTGTLGVLALICDCEGVSGNGFTLRKNAADVLVFLSGNGAGGSVTAGGPTLVVGTVYHLVATQDAAGNMSLWVNGTQYTASNGTWVVNSTNDLTIGSSIFASNQWQGTVDDFSLYSSVLTPAQVADHYLAGTSGRGPARVTSIKRAPAESVSSSDAVTRAPITRSKSISESVSAASDTVSRVVAYVRGPAESVTSSDAPTRRVTYVRGVAESVTSSDAPTRVVTNVRGIAESVSAATDSVARGIGFVRGPAESVTSSDAPTRVVAYVRGPAESVTSSDAPTRKVTYVRGPAESVAAATDAVTRAAIARSQSVAESVSAATDTPARATALFRGPAESVSAATDAVTRAALARTRNPAESVSAASDTPTRTLTFVRGVAESVSTAADAVSRAPVTRTRNPAESISAATDAVTRVFNGSRSLAESVSAATDAVSRIYTPGATGYSRSVAESVSAATDSPARIFAGSRGPAESVSTATDSVARSPLAKAASISESVSAAADTVARFTAIKRTAVTSEWGFTNLANFASDWSDGLAHLTATGTTPPTVSFDGTASPPAPAAGAGKIVWNGTSSVFPAMAVNIDLSRLWANGQTRTWSVYIKGDQAFTVGMLVTGSQGFGTVTRSITTSWQRFTDTELNNKGFDVTVTLYFFQPNVAATMWVTLYQHEDSVTASPWTPQRTSTDTPSTTATYIRSVAESVSAATDTVSRAPVARSQSIAESVAIQTGTLASDTFTRSVGSGWGTADVGGAYTVPGSPTNVNGSEGVLAAVPINTTFEARLDSGPRPVEVDSLFRSKWTDPGNATSTSFVWRYVDGNNFYFVRLQKAAAAFTVEFIERLAGTPTSLATFNLGTAAWIDATYFWLRISVRNVASGMRVRAKAWQDGNAEPAWWQVDFIDTSPQWATGGKVEWRGQVGTAGPTTFTFDDFLVTASDPPTVERLFHGFRSPSESVSAASDAATRFTVVRRNPVETVSAASDSVYNLPSVPNARSIVEDITDVVTDTFGDIFSGGAFDTVSIVYTPGANTGIRAIAESVPTASASVSRRFNAHRAPAEVLTPAFDSITRSGLAAWGIIKIKAVWNPEIDMAARYSTSVIAAARYDPVMSHVGAVGMVPLVRTARYDPLSANVGRYDPADNEVARVGADREGPP